MSIVQHLFPRLNVEVRYIDHQVDIIKVNPGSSDVNVSVEGNHIMIDFDGCVFVDLHSSRGLELAKNLLNALAGAI